MLDRLKAMAGDSRSTLSATTRATDAGDVGSQRAGSITFRVDDVRPSTVPLWMSTLRESLEMRCGSRILIMPEGEIAALAPDGSFIPGAVGRESEDPGAGQEPAQRAWASQRRTSVVGSETGQDAESVALRRMARSRPMLHPLVQAVHLAFSQHRPLILSPDCIWLAIVQGFGHHVYENAEALRSRIVRHEEKKNLVIRTTSFDAEHWPELILRVSAAIRDNSDQVLYESLMCRFSTTTPSIETAMEIALMDVYERYFNYVLLCVCGIPRITLQGTPADWQRMRERIEVIATYDLGWWTSRLVPILDEFIATAEGRPDTKFWQAIYKPREAYGADVATGWISDLFPYLGDRPERRRNEYLELPRKDWIFVQDEKNSYFGRRGVTLRAFPSGLSRAPVKIKVKDSNSEIDIDLIGGFAGVGQHMDDCALFPIINWAVAEKS